MATRIGASPATYGPLSLSDANTAIRRTSNTTISLGNYRNSGSNSYYTTWTSLTSSNLPVSMKDLYGASGGLDAGQTYYSAEYSFQNGAYSTGVPGTVIYSPITYTNLQSTYSTVQRDDNPYTMLYTVTSPVVTPTSIPTGYYSLYGTGYNLNLRAYTIGSRLFASWGAMFEDPANHFYGICTDSTFYWDNGSYSYSLGVWMFYPPGPNGTWFANNPADIATTLDSTNIGHAAYVKGSTMYFGGVNKAQALTGTYTTVGEYAMFSVTSFSKQTQFRITSRFYLVESLYIKVKPKSVVIKGFLKMFNTEIEGHTTTSAQHFLKISGYYSSPVGQNDPYGYLISE